MLLVVYSSLITGSTYAYLYLGSNNNDISGSGKCEGVNYKGENISASNLVSTTNYLEGAKSTITLSKNKDCTIYTYVNLYLYTNNTTTAPITTVKALKYKIVSSNNVTYSGVVSYMGDTLLATLPLDDKEVTYTIYLYIDSTLSLGNYNDKTYSGYIYATTEQTSTVGKNEDNTKKNLGLQTIDFDYLGSEQQFVVPQTGTYQLETWGAQGGTYDGIGGLGGYTKGNISLSNFKKLYIYVGEYPKYVSGNCYLSNRNDSFNGNKFGSCSGGGGATDVRLVPNDVWYSFNSLKSRIIVAGGGGGATYSGNGGTAGGIAGYQGIGSADNNYPAGIGGNQTSSTFGFGNRGTSSGGGGYYGGEAGNSANAGGGSSFISGHDGCDAIEEESTETNIIHTGQSKHYSGLYFTNTLMIDGNGYKWTTKKEEYVGMPTHDGLGIMGGNIGNGYARITIIE